MSEAVDQPITKPCSKCREVKSATEFSPDPTMKLGLKSQCRECQRAAHRRWISNNLEKNRSNAREYQKTLDPEKRREIDRQRAIKHPGRTSKQSRAWEKANPEKTKASRKAYRARAKDKIRAAARRRYHKKPAMFAAKAHLRRVRLEVGGSFTDQDISEIRHLQKDKCAFCRQPLKGRGEIDHIVALARGGSNTRRNLQLLCRPCNASKAAKDQAKHLREKFGLLL